MSEMPIIDFEKRPLSWSAISSFRYDPEQWYKKYVLGQKQEENATMRFGKVVGERLASDPTYLSQIERPEGGLYEYELRFKVGGIPCIGFIDWWHPTIKNLKEFKTGNAWTKDKAENHGQLKFYNLGLMIKDNEIPENIHTELISMESEARGDFSYDFIDGMKPIIHPVKLTTRDCLMFGAELLKTVKEMESYAQERLAYNAEVPYTKEVSN